MNNDGKKRTKLYKENACANKHAKNNQNKWHAGMQGVNSTFAKVRVKTNEKNEKEEENEEFEKFEKKTRHTNNKLNKRYSRCELYICKGKR
jgi:hypothetical protein